jgi:hypothetical protein
MILINPFRSGGIATSYKAVKYLSLKVKQAAGPQTFPTRYVRFCIELYHVLTDTLYIVYKGSAPPDLSN